MALNQLASLFGAGGSGKTGLFGFSQENGPRERRMQNLFSAMGRMGAGLMAGGAPRIGAPAGASAFAPGLLAFQDELSRGRMQETGFEERRNKQKLREAQIANYQSQVDERNRVSTGMASGRARYGVPAAPAAPTAPGSAPVPAVPGAAAAPPSAVAAPASVPGAPPFTDPTITAMGQLPAAEAMRRFQAHGGVAGSGGTEQTLAPPPPSEAQIEAARPGATFRSTQAAGVVPADLSGLSPAELDKLATPNISKQERARISTAMGAALGRTASAPAIPSATSKPGPTPPSRAADAAVAKLLGEPKPPNTSAAPTATPPSQAPAPGEPTAPGRVALPQRVLSAAQKEMLLEMSQSGPDGYRKALELESKWLAPRDIKASDVAGMRKEFSAQSKDFILIRDAYKRIKTAAGRKSAAGDIALIFNFMKVLDPGSTVREGEFATAQNAAGVPERIRNAFNRARRGTRLGDDQRRDFVDTAGGLYSAQRDSHRNLADEYKRIATASGYRPGTVVIDYTKGVKIPTPRPASGVAAAPPVGTVVPSSTGHVITVTP